MICDKLIRCDSGVAGDVTLSGAVTRHPHDRVSGDLHRHLRLSARPGDGHCDQGDMCAIERERTAGAGDVRLFWYRRAPRLPGAAGGGTLSRHEFAGVGHYPRFDETAHREGEIAGRARTKATRRTWLSDSE